MENEQKSKDVLLPASIIVAAVLISGSIFYMVGKNQNGNNPPVDNQNNQPANAAEILKIQGGDVVLGDQSAPVTIVEYGDYQCPWCGKFFEETEKPLREEYIKTNQVKMVYRNFAFLGPESTAAAEAAECAKDQGQFWAYHDSLYAAENKDGAENNGNLNRELFVQIASNLKLDVKVFEVCIDGQKYTDKISKDKTDGQTVGVNGTPALFVNNQQAGGFLTYPQLKSAIDGALSK